MKKIILFLLLVFVSACSNSHIGEKIPFGMRKTELADIMNNPGEYDDKNVLLVGHVAGFCATSGCHFVFRDSGVAMNIYPKGFKLPKLEKGKPIKVYSHVKAGEKKVVVTALGLEVK